MLSVRNSKYNDIDWLRSKDGKSYALQKLIKEGLSGYVTIRSRSQSKLPRMKEDIIY